MPKEYFADFDLGNQYLVEEYYEQYVRDPSSVDVSWRKLFNNLAKAPGKKAEEIQKTVESPAVRISNLINSYRTYGHLMANINPISWTPVEECWQLNLDKLGFQGGELDQLFPTNGLLKPQQAPLREIIAYLKKIYSNSIGIEYMGLQNPNLEKWLQDQMEPSLFKMDVSIDKKKMILQYLNKSELFETFLHTKYVGQKRFSLEGGETLIPMIAEIIDAGENLGTKEFVIGMAHRGRLNVLSNILDKSYSQIFTEFEEGYVPVSFEGTGDVKYHKGFSSELTLEKGEVVKVDLTPNPSHLEAVYPVVQGQVKAKQILMDDLELHQKVIPILIHGDASISGQGVVYETLQMYKLKGYSTGGTIHIIINNQIGFTTLPKDARSTIYCSDIAKTFSAPVLHVNAERPESAVYATRLAVHLRQKFHIDVFLDLNCWRKYGHNETDEPAFTQPLEYQIIRHKKSIREIYRDYLINQGVLERKMAEALEYEFKQSLQKELTEISIPKKTKAPALPKTRPFETDPDFFKPIETFVRFSILHDITHKITAIPKDFNIHTKLKRLNNDRNLMGMGKKKIDWGMGETLAYASILSDGIDIRISGQDCCRGTFSHRHAKWTDQKKPDVYFPLKNVNASQGRFDIINSPLSEYASLGFEYGYSIAHPKSLVIWEAQFGDFSNGAQVIIDQFISTAEQKWGQKSNLVLLLPHGYEGQGPEHSSGRIERFLALSGDNNMVVINPTTPAQLFHLLRRHMLKPIQKPLIVFTPKALLRYPDCVSSLDQFAGDSFQEVIDDSALPKKIKTLVFCSGKIYYDLDLERQARKLNDMVIIRVEQLYPLHIEKLKQLIEKYKGFQKCYWVQEEPKNMGAWDFIRPILRKLLPGSIGPKYIGRRRSASPAAGSYALHKMQHKEIMEKLFRKE